MAFIVTMFGGKVATPDQRFFYCHADMWPRLLELGERFAWLPAGTSDNGSPGDYNCDELAKDVSAEDAEDLADALETAQKKMARGTLAVIDPPRSYLIRDDITEEELELANSPIDPKYLARFISFLRKGSFSFFWDN